MMPANNLDYMPAVKWRQGEYQALMRLPDAVKAKLRPLIMVPSIEYDFETNEAKCSPHDHATKFVKRYTAKWKERGALIDVDPSLHGEKVAGKSFITYIFDALRATKANAIPVVSLDYDAAAISDLSDAAGIDGKGIGIRARVEHLMHTLANSRFNKLSDIIGVAPEDVDFLIDLGAPAYEPYAAFGKALLSAMTTITALADYRSLTILGTAFPENMPPGKADGTLKRHDWLFYKEFIKMLPEGFRIPAFGDYTTVHPSFKADFDMRTIKPAGKIVYTTTDVWILKKGGSFRDNRLQMHDHCASIVKSGKFKGSNFSDGDSYIERCAKKDPGAGPSNLSKWKEIGINHHIMQVLEDVSKFHV
jgi:hypothetical protein